MVFLQAKKCQGLLATTRSLNETRKDPSLEPSEEAWPYHHLDFRLLASKPVRQ